MAIDWITIDKAKGNGDTTLGVSANANAATSSRNARIKITSTDGSIVKYVSVIQEGKEENYLSIIPQNLEFSKEESNAYVSIETNLYMWRATTNDDWITFPQGQTGLEKGETLRVKVYENTTGSDRNGVITITASDVYGETKIIKTINVVQYANKEVHYFTIDPYYMSLEPKAYLTENNEACAILIYSTDEWTVSVDADWIIEDTEHRTNYQYVFEVSENTGPSRTAHISFYVNGVLQRTAVIEQKEAYSINYIEYTTTDGKKINYDAYLGAGNPQASHTFENGVGKIYGTKEITDLNSPFSYMYGVNEYPKLKTVRLPSTLKTISCGLFGRCADLESVEIPDSVESIGGDCFWDCVILTSVKLPSSLTVVSYNLFIGCTSLSSVTIPDSVVKLESGAFERCTALKTLRIPKNVKEIGQHCFDGSGIVSLTLPENLETIGESAFIHCADLESITIPNKVKTIEELTFAYCSALKSITISSSSSSLTSIKRHSFLNTSSLKEITLPSTVAEMGSQVFDNSGVYTVYSYNPTAPTLYQTTILNEYTFANSNATILHYPSGSDYSKWKQRFSEDNMIADL